MIGALKEWLTAIVYAAALITVAENLTPEGTLRKIVSLVGGLMLLLVLIQPLTRLNLGDLQLDGAWYAAEIGARQQELEKSGQEELARLIAEETEAYISDKAAGMGLDCEAEVATEPGADGVPIPWSVELDCAPSAELMVWLAQELEIPEERQVFHGASG